MKREKKKLFATCPECGNVLFRSTDSDIEIKCPRCKTELAVNISGTRVSVAHKEAALRMVAEETAPYTTR